MDDRTAQGAPGGEQRDAPDRIDSPPQTAIATEAPSCPVATVLDATRRQAMWIKRARYVPG